MRCPKCSYISFDMVETCVKCGKNISKAATELEGTITSVPAPSFLRLPGQETSSEVYEETAGADAEESFDLGLDAEEEPLDLGEAGEEESMDFTLEEEHAGEAELDLGAEDEAGSDELPEIDLGGEETTEAEIDLGFAEEPQEEEEAAIGISDLAPAEEEEVEATAAGGQGLEALDVEGLDLDTGLGAADTDKVLPSVKTGTALDDFDVDLGDLMSSKD